MTPHCLPGGEAEQSGQQPQTERHGDLTLRTFVSSEGREGIAGELWPLWGFEVRTTKGEVLHKSHRELDDTDGWYVESDARDNGLGWIEDYNKR
jgi:hypothetical protein